jgi:hypothetical protein
MRKYAKAEGMREQATNPMKNTYLEGPPQRTLMDPQHLSQRIVNRGAMVSKLLLQRLLELGLIEMGRRCAVMNLPLLWAHGSDVRGGMGNASRRGLGAASRALRHHVAILSHHQHGLGG